MSRVLSSVKNYKKAEPNPSFASVEDVTLVLATRVRTLHVIAEI